MFETRFTNCGLNEPSALDRARSIRRLTWAEIATRIDGMQQFRRVVERSLVSFPGSFDPKAAEEMALLEHGIHAVNPTGLGNCKAAGCKEAPVDDTHSRAS